MPAEIIKLFQKLKTAHELPNDNTGEYNCGYVDAINLAINEVKQLSLPKDNAKGGLGKLKDFIMAAQIAAEQGECLMLNITDVLNEIERLQAVEDNAKNMSGDFGGDSVPLYNDTTNDRGTDYKKIIGSFKDLPLQSKGMTAEDKMEYAKQRVDEIFDTPCEAKQHYMAGILDGLNAASQVKQEQSITSDIERPKIEQFSKREKSLEGMQKEYKSAPTLWAYVNALDGYVDSLKIDLKQEPKWVSDQEIEEMAKEYEKKESFHCVMTKEYRNIDFIAGATEMRGRFSSPPSKEGEG